MGSLKKLLILSIWDDPWSLGEGSGVPDERHFIRRFRDAGVELHFLIPESAGGTPRREEPGVHFHTYGNVFHRARILPPPVRRLTIPYIYTFSVYGDVRRTVERLRVLKVDADANLLVVKGSVPGPNGGYVLVRSARKVGVAGKQGAAQSESA